MAQAPGWDSELLEGLEAVLDLPEIGEILPLDELHEGLNFAAPARGG